MRGEIIGDTNAHAAGRTPLTLAVPLTTAAAAAAAAAYRVGTRHGIQIQV